MEKSARMTLASGLDIPADTVADICRRYRIRELAIFGSAARGDMTSSSDVDVMVEFEPGYHPGLGWFDLEEDLARALGRKADITQKSLLKPRVRNSALKDAVVVYGG